jgi:hypothetical protein
MRPECFRAALLLLCTVLPLAAQRPDVPDRPDTAQLIERGGGAFGPWRESVAEHGRLGAAFLATGTRFNVLVLTPMAVDLLANDSLIVEHTRGCQAALQLPDSLVEQTAQIEPWSAFDEATHALPLVVFTILPADPIHMTCGRGELARFSSVARGVLYGVTPAYSRVYDAAYAEVRRAGSLERSVMLGRAPVVKFSRGRSHLDGTQQVRLYVEPEIFAPDASGEDAELALFVWNPEDPEPDILPLPGELSRAVWQQFLPWRATRLGLDGTQPRDGLRLEFEAPRDSALRAAWERYEAGALGESAAAVMARLLRRPFPPRTEMRNAMLQTASAFAAYDEREGAVAMIADVMEAFPCLTLASNTHEELREMVESVRPPARCTHVPLPLVAVRSIIPGGGQWTSPLRKNWGRTLFLATTGSYLMSQTLRAYSRRNYQDYLANRGLSNTPAVAQFKRADLGRKWANISLIGAGAIWTYAAGEALLVEYLHKRRLDAVRDLGGAPRRAPRSAQVSPVVTPSGVGLAVSFR